MTQQEFFEIVLTTLESLRIPYMVTGSVASMLYGDPRLTNDIDIVVEIKPEHARPLAQSFSGGDYHIAPPDLLEGRILAGGPIAILHVPTLSKADLVLRKDNDFAREEFLRRRRVSFTESTDILAATPEDIILSKLQFYALGGSEKHLRDIQGILQNSQALIDSSYLERWVSRLGLAKEWSKAVAWKDRAVDD